MVKTQIPERRRDTYAITLPREGIDVSGYEGIPKKGESVAFSRAHAVSQYLHRKNKEIAKLILNKLSQRPGGLEACAVLGQSPHEEHANVGRAGYRQGNLFSQ